MKKAETKTRNNILKALKESFPLGLFFHVHGNPFQEAGIPDIIGCVDGHFYGLEVKEPGGEATKIQIHFGQRITIAKGHFMVVEDPQEAVRFIQEWVLRHYVTKSSKGV